MRQEKKFPIGFWNYTDINRHGINHDPESCVKDWAEAGMTFAMSPDYVSAPEDLQRIRAILDAADSAGIKVILSHRGVQWKRLTDQGEENYRRDFKQALDELGGHPAVFGFHVGDEPNRAALPDAYKAHRIQKEMAPDLTPFLNLLAMDPGNAPTIAYENRQSYFDDYIESAGRPLLCYDYYGHMNPEPDSESAGFQGFEGYFENLRIFHQAARRHDMDYWTTLLSVGHYTCRCPNEDDFRWQVNTAAAGGVKGILWFFFYMRFPHENYRLSPIDEHWERTETYGWLSRVCRTFLKWQAPVLLNSELVESWHYGKAWGGWPEFDGKSFVSQAHSSAGTPLIISLFKHKSGADYLAVVNNSQNKTTEAKIVITGDKPDLYRVAWENTEVPFARGAARAPNYGEDYMKVFFNLAPGQMELFRITNRKEED